MEMATCDRQKLVETVWSYAEVRPCIITMTKSGRMFVSINPLTDPKVIVAKRKTQSTNPSE